MLSIHLHAHVLILMTQKHILLQVIGNEYCISIINSVRDRLIERFNDTNVMIDECNCKRMYNLLIDQ